VSQYKTLDQLVTELEELQDIVLQEVEAQEAFWRMIVAGQRQRLLKAASECDETHMTELLLRRARASK